MGEPEMSGFPPCRPLAVTIPAAMRMSGLGRSALYEYIKAGRLRVLKNGRRTLVRVEALDALLRSLEAPDAAA
jgi:Helix-turn-helix domain